MRLEHLSSLPAEGVPIRLAGSAQIGGVEIAVTVEHFAEAERDRRGRRAPDVETRPACEILTEVEPFRPMALDGCSPGAARARDAPVATSMLQGRPEEDSEGHLQTSRGRRTARPPSR